MTDFKMKVGEIEIVALTDMNCVYPTPLDELWPKVPLADWDDYRQSFPDTFEGAAHMRIEIGCYLVRSGGKTILIDTGYGDGPFENLGGVRGDDLDLANLRFLARASPFRSLSLASIHYSSIISKSIRGLLAAKVQYLVTF